MLLLGPVDTKATSVSPVCPLLHPQRSCSAWRSPALLQASGRLSCCRWLAVSAPHHARRLALEGGNGLGNDRRISTGSRSSLWPSSRSTCSPTVAVAPATGRRVRTGRAMGRGRGTRPGSAARLAARHLVIALLTVHLAGNWEPSFADVPGATFARFMISIVPSLSSVTATPGARWVHRDACRPLIAGTVAMTVVGVLIAVTVLSSLFVEDGRSPSGEYATSGFLLTDLRTIFSVAVLISRPWLPLGRWRSPGGCRRATLFRCAGSRPSRFPLTMVLVWALRTVTSADMWSEV